MLTDFNDLYCASGAAEVRKQLESARKAFQRAPNNAGPSLPPSNGDARAHESPVPPGGVQGANSIELTLKRFALIYGTTDVWDGHRQTRLKRSAFASLVGKDIAGHWYDSQQKRVVHPENVRAAIAAQQKQVQSCDGKISVSDALERYTYLHPSKTVWDHHLSEVVNIEDLKFAIPDVIDIWLRHPDRREILKRNLVFDPCQSLCPTTHINMFNGLPLQPDHDSSKCAAILELSFYLCNGETDVWWWLMRWLAYPLQNVGAKMATAILMHSEVHGSGKSLLFDVVMRPIYGEYGATLGQHQMETPYTDWQSKLLYGVFEELFSRDGKHENLGRLKQLITGARVRIEKKFVSSWEEANHMNSVFLSNEIMPFPLEPSDRRFLVIWPNEKMSVDLQNRVAAEVASGGVNAFYQYLLDVNLDGFGKHTKPPITAAKEALIEFSQATWEFFYAEWRAGCLEAPYLTCAVTQLYELYKRWCSKAGESAMGRNKFGNLMSRRVRMRKNLHYEYALERRQQAFFIVGDEPNGKNQAEWLGECFIQFQRYID